jgi:hypothetical protein
VDPGFPRDGKNLRATDSQCIADRQPSKTAGGARTGSTIRKPQSKFRENLRPAQMVSPAKMTVWLIYCGHLD